MSRTLSELKQECQGNGIDFSSFKGSDAFELALQKYYWEQKNPGVPVSIQIDVMLGRDASKLTREEFEKQFDNDNWVGQLKLDGGRLLLILEDGKELRATSRRRSDVDFLHEEKQERVPHLTKNFGWKFKGLTVLDGEVLHSKKSIITVEGTETKSVLQTAMAMLNSGPEKSLIMQKEYGYLEYVVFDILWLNGLDLRDKSQAERFKLLNDFISSQHDSEYLRVVKQWSLKEAEGSFYSLFKRLVKEGYEGLMLKNVNGSYCDVGRPKTLWKMKKSVTYDSFITGFVPGDKDGAYRDLIGAFEFSSFIDGVETKIGAVSAIPLEMRKEATFHRADGGYQLKTEFLGRCAEIKGMSVSKNGRLNHCQLVGWRPDKAPSDCQILGSLYYGESNEIIN